MSKKLLLEELYNLYTDFKNSSLYIQGATTLVKGEGDPESPLLFIGEAPGRDEDLQGRPFVGRSGKLLTLALSKAGLARENVFITNIVKCRPPENRTPTPEEARIGKKLVLQHELDIIKPKIVVCLGLSALQGLFEQPFSMSKVRGALIPYNGTQIFPTFHPAYVLRNPAAGETFFSDIQKAVSLAFTEPPL